MKLYYSYVVTDETKSKFENKTVDRVFQDVEYKPSSTNIKSIYWKGETTDQYFEFLYSNGVFLGSIADRENDLPQNRCIIGTHIIAKEYADKIAKYVPNLSSVKIGSDITSAFDKLPETEANEVKSIFNEFITKTKNGELESINMDDIIEFLKWKKSDGYKYDEL